MNYQTQQPQDVRTLMQQIKQMQSSIDGLRNTIKRNNKKIMDFKSIRKNNRDWIQNIQHKNNYLQQIIQKLNAEIEEKEMDIVGLLFVIEQFEKKEQIDGNAAVNNGPLATVVIDLTNSNDPTPTNGNHPTSTNDNESIQNDPAPRIKNCSNDSMQMIDDTTERKETENDDMRKDEVMKSDDAATDVVKEYVQQGIQTEDWYLEELSKLQRKCDRYKQRIKEQQAEIEAERRRQDYEDDEYESDKSDEEPEDGESLDNFISDDENDDDTDPDFELDEDVQMQSSNVEQDSQSSEYK